VAGAWLLGTGRAVDADPVRQGRRAPRAVLLAVRDGDDDNGQALGGAASMRELTRLAETDGLTVVGEVVQGRRRPDPATFVGAGKVDELAATVRASNADLVIADAALTPAQGRNLESRVGVRVADRTALILDIFAQHARSSEGRTQVELAQIAYELPRLRGQGAAMSRVGGGRVAGGAGMGVRGPG
jgi:GTP-binding protein HflX